MAEIGQMDTTIPMGLNFGNSGGASPLEMLSTFSQVQNRLNENRLFQQTFAARQRAGQILAGAPDTETGLAALLKDPVTAPFAGDIVNSIRQGMLAQLQYSGEVQAQSITGLQAVLKGISGSIADPSQLPTLVAANMATLSPQAYARVAPAVNTFVQGILAGLPDDPKQAREVYNNRVAAAAMAAGVTPEVIRAMTGSMVPTVVQGTGPEGQAVTGVVGGPAAGPNPFSMPNQLMPQQAPPAAPSATDPSTWPSELQSLRNDIVSELKKKNWSQKDIDAYMQGWDTSVGRALPAVPSNSLMPPEPPASSDGGMNVLFEGPGKTRSTEMEKIGESAGEVSTSMAEDAEAIPVSLKRLDILYSTLENFQAGGGADFRLTVAKGLQALKNAKILDIDNNLIDSVGNGSLPDSQLFNSAIKPLVIGQLKEAAQGTGRVMRSEVDAFLALMDLTTDPRAIVDLLNQAKLTLSIGYDRSQKFLDFKRRLRANDPELNGLDITDYYTYYNKNLYDPTNLESPKGMDLGPYDKSKVKGGTGPAASRPSLDTFMPKK